jgi:hypothetical protein
MYKLFILLLVSFSFVNQAASQTLRAGRVAVSADGNANDRDDIGATPATLAMLAQAGVTAQRKLVHYEYNNHIWFNSSSTQKSDMTYSAVNAAKRFGFSSNIFFSVIDNPTAAYTHLAAEINKSTYANPLYILAMGPMESICQAIKRSYTSPRQYVTVISHSTWNETYQRNGSCTWTGIKANGVKTIHITDQNAPYFATNSYSDVSWLPAHPDPNIRWVWSRMNMSHTFYSAADISDAGIAWYWLKYDQYGNFAKLKSDLAWPPCTALTSNRSVKLCSPVNGSTVGSPMHFEAQITDTSSISASVYIDGVLKLSSTNKCLSWSWVLPSGTHNLVVDVWDSAGEFSTSATFTTP